MREVCECMVHSAARRLSGDKDFKYVPSSTHDVAAVMYYL